MTTLLLRFPGRRYHATPWGHHVNEGLVEWPPSPWRLLRALLSVGFTACGWREVPLEGRALIEALASAPPCYHLPPAAGTHSRHYMPIIKGRSQTTTLVFDTWAQVDDGVLSVTWPVNLSAHQRRLLGDLAVRLNYLGRSESWVDARLADADPADDANCWPEGSAPPPGPGWEQVPLLAPIPADDYAAWRQPLAVQALADLPALPQGKKKLTKKDRDLRQARTKAEDVYPSDLIACLLADTAFLRDHGWSQAPGSRRVFYWRRSDALEAGAPQPIPVVPRSTTVEAMLLSLTTASSSDHALPSVTRALPQGELLHRSLVALAGRRKHVDCPAIIGKDASGKPLQGHHHAHILHLDLDKDGHLDHCLVWAPMGLGAVAQTAVRAARRAYTKGGSAPLRMATAGIGSLDSLRRFPGNLGRALSAILGPRAGARIWVSYTPFVAPRFIKRAGHNRLAGQVAAELESRNLPTADVEVLDPRDPALLSLRHAIRRRRKGPLPPVDCGYLLRLTFSVPVTGPIALGYASHFGLGLFAVEPDSEAGV